MGAYVLYSWPRDMQTTLSIFEQVDKDANLHERDIAWTEQFNMLYIDQPVGTGYSFTDKEQGYATTEDDVARDLYEALRQFYIVFPKLLQNEFYISGESYAGK